MKRISLLVLFIIISLVSFSQQDTTKAEKKKNVEFSKDNFGDQLASLKDAQRNIKEGDRYYFLHSNYHSIALEYYQKAEKLNPNNAELNMKIGNCLLSSPIKNQALPYLEGALEASNELEREIHYYLGQAYQFNMQWDKAEEQYSIYKKYIAEGQDDVKKDVRERIKQCERGKIMTQDTANVEITILKSEVNTIAPEYSPIITADEELMLFTSRRANSTGGEKDPYRNDWFEDIYQAKSVDSVNWSNATNLGAPINTNGNESAIGLSNDGQKMFLFRDNGKTQGDIFVAQRRGSIWQEPEKLPETINTKYHESSASFSPDEKIIYFVSDNPETSTGGRDIFYSKKDERGHYGEAKNLGRTINTTGDEECVFMHPDGVTLYFSSDGHDGMGGQDIFKSKLDKETGKWSEPENLGFPINTPDADVYFVMSASGEHGYYSSFKADGTGGTDIYKITFLDSMKEEPALNLVTGLVLDEETKEPIEAYLEVTDRNTGELIGLYKSDPETGKYLISLPAGRDYDITVNAPGYLFHNFDISIPEGEGYQEVLNDIYLKPIKAGTKLVLKNVFYDFGKATLRPESQNELNRLMRILDEYPSMQVEISGHTDDVGSYNYNQKLSERRAASVVDYLVKQGVPKSRLVYNGYAFKFPVATNESEEGRQLNRRTEFKILKIDDSDIQSVQAKYDDYEEEYIYGDKGFNNVNQYIPPVNTSDNKTGSTGHSDPLNSANCLPQKFVFADVDSDCNISSDEIFISIDGFFDGSLEDVSTDRLMELIDFFFEQ